MDVRIYTGISVSHKDIEYFKKYNLGMMISTVRKQSIIRPWFKDFPLALDNGAFMAWRRNKPFPEYMFLKTLDRCMQFEFNLNFIVCPDIVCGGLKSLDFSLFWLNRLQCSNLALAVQDGIEPKHIAPVIDHFEYIFVGGGISWKFQSLPIWREFCDTYNKKLHVGRVGVPTWLTYTSRYADSCDSTSFKRNGTWSKIDEYLGVKPYQLRIKYDES